jgi:hypothetical protein
MRTTVHRYRDRTQHFDIACRRIEEATRQPDMFIVACRPQSPGIVAADPAQLELALARTILR